MNHSKINLQARSLQAIAAIVASAACCVAGAQTDTNATDPSTGAPMTGTRAKPASSPTSSPKGPSKAMPANPASPHDPYDNAAPTSAGQTKTPSHHGKKHQAKQPQNAASANNQDAAPDSSLQDAQPGGMSR